jgi:magnesium transporter
VPSLPRIKRPRPRTQARDATARPEPRVAELRAHGLTWVHLDNPGHEEATALAERFGWHPLDLEDVLSKRQRPKVDEYPEYLFGVLHFPVYDKAVQRLNAADLFDYCFPILDKIGHKLDSVEDDLFEKRAEEVVRDLSNVKQEIISYRKIIKPERSTLRLLERHIERFLPQQLELYFDDIVDASERIWDLLDNYKEVVEALEDTNESVISHRQNDVLRFLTVVTVILLPLTLITGIFGMNVHFPGFGTAAAFWAIIGGMVGLAIGLTAFFRLKRWL